MTIGAAANSYEILSKLAEGGMAELFLARAHGAAPGAQRYVVLKRIAKSRATDTQYVQMFLDEARLASQLHHPNIAQVFDIGRLGASYYFTMEYVHGVTVQDLVLRALDREVLLPIGAVLAIVGGTAAGLAHAHEQRGADGSPLGIVHRDVSPSNLIVSYEGHLKVVDFGVAKAMGRPETMAGEIKGKVGYLSPEQCRMQKIDRRSDLYSLGVCAWEMLTLRRLWQRDTAFGTLASIATEVAPTVSTLRDGTPVEVDAFVRKLLTLDPNERFQTAQEVVEAAEQVALRTQSPTTSAYLARLLRELFGAPREPWHALADNSVNVIATPVPPDQSVDTFDDEPSRDDVELKLTAVFQAQTDASETNILEQFPSSPGDAAATNILDQFTNNDETREVPALARATSVGDAAPLAPPPGFAPFAIQAGDPDPSLSRTMLGTGEAPMRLSAPGLVGTGPQVPPVAGSGPRASVPQLAPVGVPNSSPRPSAPQIPGSGPRGFPSGPRPFDPNQIAPTAAHIVDPPRGSAAQIAPTAMHVLPGSGPRPFDPAQIAPTAAHVMPGSGPQIPNPGSSTAMPPGAAQLALPRYPPPPHGDMGLLRWFVIGGAVLGIGAVILVLALRSEPTTPSSGDPIVIVATPPDASAVAIDASAVAIDASAVVIDASAVAIDASVAIDAASVADAQAAPIDAPLERTKLRTKNDLNVAFRKERYAEIVAACTELGADGDRAVVCTLAACRAHDDKAQEWFKNVAPKQRKGTIQICGDAKHTITDVCATDPSACRK